MTPSSTSRQRLRSQLLTGAPARSAEGVVSRLLAVQAQDPRGARLAIRARSTGVTAADLDAGLTERRSMVVTWLNRGTLHLVTAEDYWWLHPLTTPQLRVSNERRLAQEGVSPRQAARGVDAIAAAVARGPQTRDQLRERLVAAGVPTKGQALVHVLFAAAQRQVVVRGPMVGSAQAFVSPTEWLGPAPEPVDRGEALARLAQRYLEGHAPADDRDLARWAGITLGDARVGLQGTDTTGPDADDVAPPQLLGPFEPLLLGWTSRDDYIGEHTGLVTNNGLFRPFALVDGRAVATWSIAKGKVRITELESVAPKDVAALEADGERVLAYLGLDRT